MDSLEYLYDERVALRPLEESDAPQMAGWVNDQAALHYLGLTGGLSLDEERAFITRSRESRTDRIFGIVRREDGRLIGATALHGIGGANQHATFGIWLGERDCWGQGYGTAACRLICDFGFNRLNLHRINLTVIAFNARGVKSYEKVGFSLEGRLRENIWRDGAFHDELCMGLMREEFNARWADWRGQQRQRYGIGE